MPKSYYSSSHEVVHPSSKLGALQHYRTPYQMEPTLKIDLIRQAEMYLEKLLNRVQRLPWFLKHFFLFKKREAPFFVVAMSATHYHFLFTYLSIYLKVPSTKT
ncbi:hypothetical protein HS088_TW06G00036 [Tripterygium wilfordii]|uniref:Uncharacterized protein n=1 Tax=Tripterygium wilfordii TaxID=458696 RepID=A0A7J7DHP7_TRIWF|nr:hypothetical protein HS088_TW06G00036 [Tripterygium wilfordii]